MFYNEKTKKYIYILKNRKYGVTFLIIFIWFLELF